jgi:hypothetical protein
MAAPPIVSIVVPCRIATDQQAALLEETLQSVDTQRGVDYDFYLRAAHRFAACCAAARPVTRYRRYPASSSRDGERMLASVRAVYERQRPLVAGDAAGQAAFDRGLARLVEIFRDCLVENIEHRLALGDRAGASRAAMRLQAESPARWRDTLARLSVPL